MEAKRSTWEQVESKQVIQLSIKVAQVDSLTWGWVVDNNVSTLIRPNDVIDNWQLSEHCNVLITLLWTIYYVCPLPFISLYFKSFDYNKNWAKPPERFVCLPLPNSACDLALATPSLTTPPPSPPSPWLHLKRCSEKSSFLLFKNVKRMNLRFRIVIPFMCFYIWNK